MLIVVYLLYAFFGILYMGFAQILETPQIQVDMVMLVLQIIFFGVIVFLWRGKNSRKDIKAMVLETFNDPIIKRPTYMRIQHWIMIVLVYELSFTSFIGNVWMFYISSFLLYALMILLAYPLFVESNLSLKKQGIFKIIMFGVIGFIASFGLDYITEFLKNFIANAPTEAENQVMVVKMIKDDPIRMILEVAISAAITEEIVFRGLGFRTMLHRNRFVAYFVTFMLFGFVHLIPGLVENGIVELAFLPIYGGAGLLNAFVYHKSESIYPPMIVHFLNNLFSFVAIMYF